MATLKERVDKHDREIAAIRKLLMIGAKTLVQVDKRLDRLVQSQEETGRQIRQLKDTVDRVVRSIERREGNGHKKTAIR